MSVRQTTFDQKSFLTKIYVASIAVVGVYFSLYPLLKPTLTQVILLALLGCAFTAGYFFSLRSTDQSRPSHYYIICCYLILLVNALINGGIGTPSIIWLLLCPLIAFITLSTKVARTWLFIILITVSLLFACKDIIAKRAWDNLEVWYMISYLLFFPMVYSIMRIFRREVSKKNVELSVLNEKLSIEREMLESTQLEILYQSEKIKDAERRAQQRSEKLSFYLDQLIEVKRMEEVHSGNLEYSLYAILQFMQRSMTLKNVALWSLNEDSTCLKLFRYKGNGEEVYERALLHRKDFLLAFEMLETGAVINQCDDTKEARQLTELFKDSVGNNAMINCPYFLDGKFAGFISCRSSERSWMPEDIIFVRAISDTISLAFKSHQRLIQQHILQEKQKEITEINESLERKVSERTSELNIRNKQLMDFAFTNAHHIRGPICRLLGLENLLMATKDSEEIFRIASYMSASITELDKITREISLRLNAMIGEDEA